MKLSHLLFLLAFFSFAACGDDDGISGDPNLLSYDGDNASAPELEAGIHELAIYFPGSDLTNRIGKKLDEVEVFVDLGASSYKVKVHGPGTSTAPGPVLREVDFTSQVVSRAWKIIDIDPLEITGEDLWIAVEVVHDQTAQTVGCDSGPRKNGGDWIWDSLVNAWDTFFSKTGTESVNWNIRGHLID